MLELDLRQYLLHEYPQENARCEWKKFKNLKSFQRFGSRKKVFPRKKYQSLIFGYKIRLISLIHNTLP